MRNALLACLLCGVALAHAAPGDVVEEPAWNALKDDGAVVLIRHASAPGVGDPPGFRLGDCRTQRNLDDAGRREAVRLGMRFRARGIVVGKVLASQWCRTRETAALAFPGQVVEEPIFNSFFADASNDPKQTAAARSLLAAWTGPGALVVVTHQVNITALTGIVPGSGEGVVLRRAGTGRDVVGRVAASP